MSCCKSFEDISCPLELEISLFKLDISIPSRLIGFPRHLKDVSVLSGAHYTNGSTYPSFKDIACPNDIPYSLLEPKTLACRVALSIERNSYHKYLSQSFETLGRIVVALSNKFRA